MALHWGNRASTTHSLTPSPLNRPLFFWILTPHKKPEATGSAGRCELGVGRFTDPHPFTCCKITPSDFCLILGNVCRPLAFSNQSSEWRIISLFIMGFQTPMRCHCRPGWACFFLFCFSLVPLNDFSPSGGNADFHLPGFRRCPLDSFTTGSHAANRADLELRWCPFPAHSLTGHKSLHRGEFCFCP